MPSQQPAAVHSPLPGCSVLLLTYTHCAHPATDVPVIFSTLGSGRSAALLNTVIIGAVNVLATVVSIFSVDKFGRRGLFLEGGVQMFIGQVVTGAVLAVEFQTYSTSDLPKGVAIGLLIVICVYVSAFAW